MGVYNGGNGVFRAIESILSQENVCIELICVDDGSTDTTGVVLKHYAETDKRVRHIRQEKAGLTMALIRGCSVACGEYIARQDAGDISLPGRLAMQKSVLDRDPDVVVVGGAYDLIGPNGEVLFENCMTDEKTEDMGLALISGDPERLRGPCHAAVMYRKTAYEKAGGYRPEFYIGQDLDLWTRMAEIGKFFQLSKKLCLVEFSNGGISWRYHQEQVQIKSLIAEASRARMQGRDESIVLAKAANIRPSGNRSAKSTESRAAYFVGSCLAARNDPRAMYYFLESVKQNPLQFKGWIKLLWGKILDRVQGRLLREEFDD